MKEYQVLQDHNGERPYAAGQTRICPEVLGEILVDAGVLAEAPKAKAAKAAPKNKAANHADTGND